MGIFMDRHEVLRLLVVLGGRFQVHLWVDAFYLYTRAKPGLSCSGVRCVFFASYSECSNAVGLQLSRAYFAGTLDHCLLGKALHEVREGTLTPIWEVEERWQWRSLACRAFLVKVYQMLSLVPCTAHAVHGAAGHNRGGAAETQSLARTQGRNVDRRFIF